jgi:hypothetical protein
LKHFVKCLKISCVSFLETCRQAQFIELFAIF